MLKIIECFAGIGSQTQALKNLGIEHEVVAISEIDKYAMLSYEAMHGNANNLGDITKIKELPQADLWTYSFPCFVGNTLVLTENGYKQIEDIQRGDKVLTHNNRYKEVIATMNQGEKNIVKITAMGVDEIKCTPNHRFYVREKYRKYLHNPNRNLRLFKEPVWKEAKDLTKADYFGVAINQNETVPDWDGISFEWNDGRKTRYKNELRCQMYNPDFWWIIGRYIGDGWERSQGGIIICCAKDELNEITERLEKLFNYSVAEEMSTYKIHIPLKELGLFVSQFGKGAANKRLTKTIFDLPKDLLRFFLAGYLTADGCYTQELLNASSVSRELIYGIGHCMAKVFNRPYSIHKSSRPSKCIIEGREVNQKSSYTVTCKLWNSKQDQAFYEDGYVWFPFRGIDDCVSETVYDISVKEDESFTANGVITHNCQDISVAGKGAGIKEGTRSGLLFEVERLLRVAEQNDTLPKYLLLENVKNLIGKKFRADFDSWLLFLSSLGYTNYWQVLNAKHYGIPQHRERVFCVSIRGEHKPFVFPEKQELTLRLRDMIDEVVDDRYYLKESTIRSIMHSNFNQRRDSIRPRDGVANTLCARDWRGPQCVQVGELTGEKWDKMHDISRRVYEPDGLSPTVHCAGGGNTEVKIVAMRGRTRKPSCQWQVGSQTSVSCGSFGKTEQDATKGSSEGSERKSNDELGGRNPDNPSDRTAGAPTEQRLEPNSQGLCNALTTVQKDNLVMENAYVARRYSEFIEDKGYVPEMFVAYNKTEVEDVAPTLTVQCSSFGGSSAVLKMELDDVKILAPNNWNHKAGEGMTTRERIEKDICPALQATPGKTQQSFLKIKSASARGYDEAEEGDYINTSYPNSDSKRGRVGKGVAHALCTCDKQAVVTENVRIRKLTPRECLRLMGWKDEQIDKIQEAKVSGTQQYRQAGNGIVVQVLMAIFERLFLC